MTQPEQDMGYMIHERIGGGTRVGDLLRRRRAELGQDIGVVAKSLRIRQRYLEAIEEGRLGDLPGPTYVLGFVRSYAEHLGFDGGKIISEFRQEVGVAGPPTPMNWKPQTPASGGSAKIVVALLVLGALAVGWYFLGREVAPDSLIQSLPEFLQPRAEAVVPEPASVAADQGGEAGAGEPMAAVTEGSIGEDDTSGEAGAVAASPDSATATSATQTTEAPGASTEASSAMTSADGQSESLGQTEPAATAEATAGTSTSDGAAGESEQAAASLQSGEASGAASSEGAATAPRMVIRARLESWVEITNAKQEILVSRVLRAGETYVVPDEPGLVLNTGNAGGLDIEIDGRTAPSLGSIGLVRRGVALDPALIAGGQSQSPPGEPEAPATPPADEATGD